MKIEMAETICCHCGKIVKKYIGHINRAKKLGVNIYCNRTCAGLGRRSKETPEEKKQIKAWYDAFLMVSRTEKEKRADKERRAAYFQKDYAANPEKYKGWRKKRQSKHNEYCRQPEYKAYKKEYDQQYRAKKHYGKYWEAFVALRNLQGVVDNRRGKQESKIYNKSQKRKRHAKKLIKRKEFESCTVGIYQRR